MTHATDHSGSRYVVNVQILRLVAALLVVFAHAHAETLNIAARTGASVGGIGLLDWGLGVDIFFVISGFIMYYMMHDRFGRPGTSADFLRRRLIRIVPLYWLTTGLMLLSILAASSLINNAGLDPAHILASFVFLPWPRTDGELFPVLSLGWTLNYEMMFYAVFAVALTMTRRGGLLFTAGVFVLLLLASAIAPAESWFLRFWGNTIIGEFLLGIALAALYLRGVRIGLAVMVAMIALGIALAVWLFQVSAYETWGRAVTGGMPAILIAAAAVLGPAAADTRLVRLLAFGGAASYALYLTHPFALKLSGIVTSRIGLPLTATLVVGILAALVASALVHLWIERPIGSWLSQRSRRRMTRSPA